nr:MFS transporter [Rhizocola hellebori]
MAPYRQVLAQPGLKLLMLVGMLARIPVTAAAMTVTLHVVNTLGLNFARAGLAGALAMLGVGIGSPLLGRMVDKVGLRPVLIVATVVQGIYWLTAPHLSYTALVVAAFFAGLLSIPIFSVMRQFMAAMVPIEHRRPAFALDSMGVELSYMVGPALAVALVTSLGSQFTMTAVGTGLVLGGTALIVMNPPIRSAEEEESQTVTLPRREWLRPSLIALLAATAAATFVLTATELSIVAALRHTGATKWIGLIIVAWSLYSLIGGFIYGGLRRSISPLLIIAGMAALTIPLGLVSGWWWLLLAVIPCGLLCAPSIAATVDAVSHLVPAGARGEAMGLHGTALTCGIAIGAPTGGWVIDTFGPAWGFTAAGLAGLLVVAAVFPFWQRSPATSAAAVEPELATVGANTNG